jgi:hypothetical protein
VRRLLIACTLALTACRGMGGFGSGFGHLASGLGHAAAGMSHLAVPVIEGIAHAAPVVARVATTVAIENGDLLIDAMTWGAIVHVDVDPDSEAFAEPEAVPCDQAMTQLVRSDGALASDVPGVPASGYCY